MRVLGPFYSGEVLPPFLVEQASHPCRASLSSLQSKPLILVEQVSWNVVGKSGPSSYQGPTRRMGSTFFGLVDMGLLGSPMGLLGLPSLISYFILFRIIYSEAKGRYKCNREFRNWILSSSAKFAPLKSLKIDITVASHASHSFNYFILSLSFFQFSPTPSLSLHCIIAMVLLSLLLLEQLHQLVYKGAKWKKQLLFTQFDQKITHISGCKLVYKYTITIVTVHICMVTVACVYIILLISVRINFSLSSLCTTTSVSSSSFSSDAHKHKHIHTDKSTQKHTHTQTNPHRQTNREINRCLWSLVRGLAGKDVIWVMDRPMKNWSGSWSACNGLTEKRKEKDSQKKKKKKMKKEKKERRR